RAAGVHQHRRRIVRHREIPGRTVLGVVPDLSHSRAVGGAAHHGTLIARGAWIARGPASSGPSRNPGCEGWFTGAGGTQRVSTSAVRAAPELLLERLDQILPLRARSSGLPDV